MEEMGKARKAKQTVSEPHEISDIYDHSGKDGTKTEQVGWKAVWKEITFLEPKT